MVVHSSPEGLEPLAWLASGIGDTFGRKGGELQVFAGDDGGGEDKLDSICIWCVSCACVGRPASSLA